MEKIIELLRQRRVWAFVVGVLAFLLELFKVKYEVDLPILTDLLTALGGAVSTLIVAGLALWSYLKPKK